MIVRYYSTWMYWKRIEINASLWHEICTHTDKYVELSRSHSVWNFRCTSFMRERNTIENLWSAREVCYELRTITIPQFFPNAFKYSSTELPFGVFCKSLTHIHTFTHTHIHTAHTNIRTLAWMGAIPNLNSPI